MAQFYKQTVTAQVGNLRAQVHMKLIYWIYLYPTFFFIQGTQGGIQTSPSSHFIPKAFRIHSQAWFLDKKAFSSSALDANNGLHKQEFAQSQVSW